MARPGDAADGHLRDPVFRAALARWARAQAALSLYREALGLSPVVYARIGKDLSIAQRVSDEAVRKLAEKEEG